MDSFMVWVAFFIVLVAGALTSDLSANGPVTGESLTEAEERLLDDEAVAK